MHFSIFGGRNLQGVSHYAYDAPLRYDYAAST